MVIGLMVAPIACDEAFDEEEAREQYRKDVEAAQKRRGSVLYSLTFETDPITRYEIKSYSLGDGTHLRFDMTAPGHPFLMVAITTPSGEVVCSNMASNLFDGPPDPSAAVCAEPNDAGDVAGFFLLLSLLVPYPVDPDLAFASTPSGLRGGRQLGRRTHCYDFAGYRQCLSEDGILTRLQTSGDAPFSLIAIDAGDVADTDFEPPYPIVDPD
jgi:hypothetical protein